MQRLVPNNPQIRACIGERNERPPQGYVKLRDYGKEVIYVATGLSIAEKAEIARIVNKTCGLQDHAKNTTLKGYLVQAFKATFGDDQRPVKIIEVGCGEHTILEHVGNRDCALAQRTSYVGIDIDEAVFNKARANLRDALNGCAFPSAHSFGTWETVNLSTTEGTKPVGVGVYSVHHMLTDAAEISDAANRIKSVVGTSGMFVANAYGPNFSALEQQLKTRGVSVSYVKSDIGQIAVMFPKIDHKADAATKAQQIQAGRDALSFMTDLNTAIKSASQTAPMRKVA